ncbi:MAG: GtrA family protein [Rhodocyclales bacterium]|nr:GtrA family protein [Rhodocyclales bacterium]
MSPADTGEATLPAEFARYFLASLGALALDVGILWLAAHWLHYLIAASLGFGAGAGAIYLLSTRWVFRRRKLADRAPVEFSAFVAIGLAGLALNDLVIYVAVDRFSLALLAAKALAAGASFLFNYTARKLALF